MIKDSELVSDFQQMYREHWAYEWGKHERGCVDCSGAFVYAYGQHGLYIYNGSNRIARVYISGPLIPYTEAKQKGLIVPAMAVFKHYPPTNVNYNLGSGYKPKGAYYNGDLNDYHHIGLTENDKYVLNAQGSKTGFVRSKITENWSYVAKLKDVIYEGGESMAEKQMTVIRTADAASGSKTVNVRLKPDPGSAVMYSVPFGSSVTVYSIDGNWSQIAYGGRTGWMMNKFLADPDVTSVPAEVRENLNAMQKNLDNIFDMIGRG